MRSVFIEREIEVAIKEASKYFSILTITGPRQSGKTTLIKRMFADLPYYSLEDLDVRRFALSDPKAFLEEHSSGMVLDEVQNAPQLLSYLQAIVDDNPDKRFVLSGSSQFSMLKSITQSLAGRTALFELLPMSYSEVQGVADGKSADQLLFDGFYPAIYAERNKASLLYPAYVKTYLERDVRDLLNIKDMMQFQTFLRLCASRIGSLFVASELANEVGVTVNTIQSWLSVLQASYIIVMLPPYFENINKRLTKTPKLYFLDPGVACYLLSIETPEQLARDKMRGHLFENFIVTEFLKHRYNQGKQSNLYFFRDSNGNEVDLLLKQANQFSAIEIKSSTTYNSEFEKGLKVFQNLFKDRVTSSSIVYCGNLENTTSKTKLLNYKHLGLLYQ